jgi:pyridoxal phosphate enzyme (YggS family)
MLIVPQNWAENLFRVRSHINAAAAAAGRDPTQITIVAVSKAQPLEAIRAVRALDVVDFGENYPQEALRKIEALADESVRWHFIGHLQANKTRLVAERFAWVHSIDRVQIARRLAAQRPFHAPPLNICLQVKLADEPGKGGVAPSEVKALADEVAALDRLKLRGLMCLPPATDDVAQQRRWFAELRNLQSRLNQQGHNLDVLSMGMSGDYVAAVQEGATHLRIGTAIFGERPAGAGP